jgi:hypothetical protein
MDFGDGIGKLEEEMLGMGKLRKLGKLGKLGRSGKYHI